MEATLSGKTYVISGFTSGIGLATAERLAAAGADLIGIGRSEERCKAAGMRLQHINNAIQVKWVLADLSSQSDVRRAAAEAGNILKEQHKNGLDGLVNVAGVFEYWMRLSPDGIETQWAVNHLAAFLLTHELMPWLKAAEEAKVVTVSSDSHYFGHIQWPDPQRIRHYNGLAAYGDTKLANVLFSAEFNRREGEWSSLRAFAVDPGLVKTEIGFKNTPALARWVWNLRRAGGTSAAVPAQCIYHLLVTPRQLLSKEVYWKDSRPKQESKRAKSLEEALRLWNYSEKLCGIESEGMQ